MSAASLSSSDRRSATSAIRTAMIAAVVLIVDFFVMPWIAWEARPANAVAWTTNFMPAVTLANKADAYGFWLIPICALAVLLSNFASPEQVKKSALLIGLQSFLGSGFCICSAQCPAPADERSWPSWRSR